MAAALSVKTFGLKLGLSFENGFWISILINALFVPAPLFVIIILTLIVLALSKYHFVAFESARGILNLSIIVGIISALIAFPMHFKLYQMGFDIVPFI